MAALGVICIPTAPYFSVKTAQPLSVANCLIHTVHTGDTSFQLGQKAKLLARAKKTSISIFTPRTGTLALCPALSHWELTILRALTSIPDTCSDNNSSLFPESKWKAAWLTYSEWHKLTESCSVSTLTSLLLLLSRFSCVRLCATP